MLCPASSVPPRVAAAKPATVCAPASSSTTTVLVANVTVGASFTGVTVIVKVLVVLSTPPLAVPPSSWAITVTVLEPVALAAVVKISLPLKSTVGCTEKRLLVPAVTV